MHSAYLTSLERRHNNRRVYRSIANLILPRGQGSIKVKTLDISVGGISILIESNLPIRTRCIIILQLPAIQSHFRIFEIEAIVSRCTLSHQSVFNVGLKFIDMPKSTEDLIRNFVGISLRQ